MIRATRLPGLPILLAYQPPVRRRTLHRLLANRPSYHPRCLNSVKLKNHKSAPPLDRSRTVIQQYRSFTLKLRRASANTVPPVRIDLLLPPVKAADPRHQFQ